MHHLIKIHLFSRKDHADTQLFHTFAVLLAMIVKFLVRLKQQTNISVYLLIIILGLSFSEFGCSRSNRVATAKITKPKNRKRYYNPGKDRWKKRTKRVKVKN